MGKRREKDNFFHDFATNISHVLFARRGHYGLCPCREIATCSCGHTTEYFTCSAAADCGLWWCGFVVRAGRCLTSLSLCSKKLCMKPAVLRCGGGSCSKCRMGMMWPFPCELSPPALPSTKKAMFVFALAGVRPWVSKASSSVASFPYTSVACYACCPLFLHNIQVSFCAADVWCKMSLFENNRCWRYQV